MRVIGRRLVFGSVVVVVVVGLASPAFAHDCFNASKPVTKGNSITIDTTTEEGTPIDPNPGLFHRNFAGLGNVGLDFDGDGIADASVMSPPHGTLPGPARLNCDGRGIDSFEVCASTP